MHSGCLQLTRSHYHLARITVKLSKEMEIISKNEIGQEKREKEGKD